MNIQIEKNIPIPTGRATYGERGVLSKILRELAVGESILVFKDRSPGAVSAASVIGKRDGKKFTSRKQGDAQTRIWRTE